MRAVFYTGGKKPWADVLGGRPWALLPVAGRPLLSYWLELCVDLGITEVQMVLGHDAEHIELFCGNGEKWGLEINYSFRAPGDTPQSYLARDPQRWTDGLFFVADAVFPYRQAGYVPGRLKEVASGCCACNDGKTVFFLSTDPQLIDRFVQNRTCGQSHCGKVNLVGLDITFIRDILQYYELNMTIVHGEMNRYLSSGYSPSDEASIGYNVIIPPSVTLTPPLAIGNDCRLGPLCSIGSGTVISDHVFIDRQCELSDCIILSDTYLGRNLEIKEKIVVGNRIIDPGDGSFLDLEDPWLVAKNRSSDFMRDLVRALFNWSAAFALALLQMTPFLIFYSIIRFRRLGSFVKKPVWGAGGRRTVVSYFVATDFLSSELLTIFFGASLDRFPLLLDVLAGRLWLCGQVPKPCGTQDYKEGEHYFPAVFSNSDAFSAMDRQIDALYYSHTRSLSTDLKILLHALFARLVDNNKAAEILNERI